MSGKALIGSGFVLTATFLAMCIWLGLETYCSDISEVQTCTNNFEKFLASPPNEKGDTLAGLAGSLAFLWIIITVLLQGRELSLQREELERTRTTLEKQTKFLENQDVDRRLSNTDRVVQEKLNLLLKKLPEIAFDKFRLCKTEGRVTNVKSVTFLPLNSFHEDDHPSQYTNAINKVIETIENLVSDGWEVDTPEQSLSWISCEKLADEIATQVYDGSSANQEKIIFGYKIGALRNALKKANQAKFLWGKDINETQP